LSQPVVAAGAPAPANVNVVRRTWARTSNAGACPPSLALLPSCAGDEAHAFFMVLRGGLARRFALGGFAG
jgi:hypothetical protein